MVPCSGVYFAALSTRLDTTCANRTWVAVDEDRIDTDFNIQRMSPAFDLSSTGFDGLGDNRPKVNGTTFKFKLAALDARDVEQIIRQPGHVL